MDGETVKFHRYEGSSGKISIPSSITKSLNWKHKDELTIITTTLDNQIGLFVFKKGGHLKLDTGTYSFEKVEGKKLEKQK